MSKQLRLGAKYEKYSKSTRRLQFLCEMERIASWQRHRELVAPVYPVAGDGRPPCERQR